MTIAEIATLVEKIGIGLTCVVVIIYVFISEYRVRKDVEAKKQVQKEKQEDQQFCVSMDKEKAQQEIYMNLIENITKQNQLMVEKIINEVTHHTLSPEENTTLSLIEDQINSCLRRVLEKCNASRVGLVRFHNGGRDMNKLSFLKMSMTNEVVRPGVKPLQPEFQNMFRSFLHYWCSELSDAGYCDINDVEEVREKDPTVYEFMTNRDAQAVYGISLNRATGCVIGFIVIEFNDKSDVNLTQVKDCLYDKKIKIETLMNLK